MKQLTAIFCFVFFVSGICKAQQEESLNPYVKLGQKALIDGDFKLAVSHLEKSLPADSNNANVLYMLGYSYYHSGSYPKAVNSFTRVLSLHPNEVSAYYYRGKARNILGAQMNSTLSAVEREKLLLACIKDFSRGIELNNSDIKFYQNRAIAYRDYGILKGQKTPKVYDKSAAETAYKACISDLQHVLDLNPGRKDITVEMKKAKVYMDNLSN